MPILFDDIRFRKFLRKNAKDELGAELLQNGNPGYLWVKPESNAVDFRLTAAHASCCGVNLAFAGFGGWHFS